MSGNLVFLTFLYFIQGIPYGLQTRFLPIYLRADVGESLQRIALFRLLYIPWLCKALWGPAVDNYGSKRQWLLWSIGGLSVTCLFTSFVSPYESFGLLCVAMLFLNLLTSMQDVAVDAVAVNMLSKSELGSGNTAQVVGYKLGSIFGGGLLVLFHKSFGWMGLFWVLVFLYIEGMMFVYLSPVLRELEHTDEKGDDCDDSTTGEDSLSPDEDEDMQNSELHNSAVDEVHNESKDVHKSAANADSSTATSNTNLRKRASTKIESSDKSPDAADKKVKVTNTSFSTVVQYVTALFNIPGTKWMLVFVLIYKLGEQGALSLLPLFIIDKNMNNTEVTDDDVSADVMFWTGTIGQITSITGSFLSGFLLTKYSLPYDLLLSQLCWLRLVPLGLQLWTVLLWDRHIFSHDVLFFVAIGSMNLLFLLSGAITTVTFAWMMYCSQLAPHHKKAMHYTTLATCEVLGKLVFVSLTSGWMVEQLGYATVLLLYVVLSAVMLRWFRYVPTEIGHKDSCNV